MNAQINNLRRKPKFIVTRPALTVIQGHKKHVGDRWMEQCEFCGSYYQVQMVEHRGRVMVEPYLFVHDCPTLDTDCAGVETERLDDEYAEMVALHGWDVDNMYDARNVL